MVDWIVNVAIISFVLYKLGSLTELDLGRGWLHLKFSVPRVKMDAKRKQIRR